MIWTSAARRRTSIATAVAALGCAALIAGCGSSEVDTTASMPPATSTETTKVAASGPAISSTLTFDQLALESPVTRVKKQGGITFLRFKYADTDGSIYKCEMPEAMSKGSYSIEEWARTFRIYRLPQVVGHKKVVKKKGPAQFGDFPFISPKPRPVRQAPAQPTQPEAVPATPPLPGGTSSSTPSPGAMPPPPGVMPPQSRSAD